MLQTSKQITPHSHSFSMGHGEIITLGLYENARRGIIQEKKTKVEDEDEDEAKQPSSNS